MSVTRTFSSGHVAEATLKKPNSNAASARWASAFEKGIEGRPTVKKLLLKGLIGFGRDLLPSRG
jgi:hypothetical protein